MTVDAEPIGTMNDLMVDRAENAVKIGNDAARESTPASLSRSHFSPADVDRANLEIMQKWLAMGLIKLVRGRIANHGDQLAKSQDPYVRREYGSFHTRALHAFKIEDAHGAGSLLDYTHPIVANLAGVWCKKTKSFLITHEEIEAAKVYRINCEATQALDDGLPLD